MEDQEVDAILTGLQPNIPFTSRAEFIKCIAALCAKYSHEVGIVLNYYQYGVLYLGSWALYIFPSFREQ